MADVRTFDSFAVLNAAIDELQISDKEVTFVRQTSTKNFGCDGAYCFMLPFILSSANHPLYLRHQVMT